MSINTPVVLFLKLITIIYSKLGNISTEETLEPDAPAVFSDICWLEGDHEKGENWHLFASSTPSALWETI